MSFQEHEKLHIKQNIKRDLTKTELQVLAAEWSEHCSYKSSKKHLRMLPTTGMTLPFLSYGGSSLIGNSIIAGIILNFTRRDNKRFFNHE